MDMALERVVENIMYLASHEGKMSDHVYAFVYLTERKLFQGIIHCLVDSICTDNNDPFVSAPNHCVPAKLSPLILS